MDTLGVRQMKSRKNSKRSNSKKNFKVVYISNPIKVKTCASQFRALVQELTGKDSDAVDRFMDNSNYNSTPENSPSNSDATRVITEDDRVLGQPLLNSNNESVFDPFDDGLVSEGSFLGMFTSNIFHDPSQFDATRSFGSI